MGYFTVKDMIEGTFVMTEDTMVVLGLGILMFLVGIWGIIEINTKHIILTNTFINSHNFFSKDQELRWSEITSIVFDDQKRNIVLSNGTNSIKVMRMYVGSSIILRMITDKVNVSVYYYSLNDNIKYLGELLQNFSGEEINTFKEKVEKFLTNGIDSNMLEMS
jgi:hypothetical protein